MNQEAKDHAEALVAQAVTECKLHLKEASDAITAERPNVIEEIRKALETCIRAVAIRQALHEMNRD